MKKKIILLLFFNSCLYLFANNNIELLKKRMGTDTFVLSFYYDVLESNERETVFEYTDAYKDFTISDMDGDTFYNWYERNVFVTEDCSFYYSERWRTDTLSVGFNHAYCVSDVKKNSEDSYILEGYEPENNYLMDDYTAIDWFYFHFGDIKQLYFNFDGDYLNISYMYNNSEHLLASFCRMDSNTLSEFESLIHDDKCNLSKVTWPRHADGTSDYDDEIKQPLTQPVDNTSSLETKAKKISPAQTMSVTENLKLRSAEATTSEVITVMAAGTKVKILELGHSETIDGITSNWVKVMVLADATDRDGNLIEKGTTGWCYGGYLEETEDFIADNEDEIITADVQAVQEATPEVIHSSNLLLIVILIVSLVVILGVIIIIFVMKKHKKEESENVR